MRRILVALLIAFALGNTSSASALSVDPAVLAAQVDAYWAGQFAEHGLSYTTPSVFIVEGYVDTPCGLTDMGPFYCLVDGKIYLAVEGNLSDGGWFVIMAHEWSHYVQDQLGLPYAELQADCLAGATIGNAVDMGWAPGSAYNGALRTAIRGGDDFAFGVPEEELTHGIAGHRSEEFNRGFLKGISACGTLF